MTMKPADQKVDKGVEGRQVGRVCEQAGARLDK